MKFAYVLSIGTVMAMGSVSTAQHAGDVLLRIENGRMTTNLIEEGGGIVTPGVRVFGSEFGEVAPNFSDEPGFDNEAGTFTPGSSIGFNVRRALRRWDGVNFDTVAAERLSIGYGPISPVLTPLVDEVTTGFVIEVDDMGNWHNHLEYTLGTPASDGVYLLEMTLFSDQASLQESLPFWFVFNQGAGELVHDEAIEWVESNLVPTPGAGAVLVAVGLFSIRRQRTSPRKY